MTITPITTTNLRRDVLGTMLYWPMTAADICSELNIQNHSKTCVDRSLAWACKNGYAERCGTVRGTAKRGCHAFLFQITDKGRTVFAAIRNVTLPNAQSRHIVEVEV